MAVDTREPLRTLSCVDRALIPGDIVRRTDVNAGLESDRGGRERDAMGMVVGTEVMLDLVEIGSDATHRAIRRGVPASSLRHLVPIRLATWVVHRGDGWLGRVQSWDEDLVIRFKAVGANDTPCRCRVRAANQKQGITITESFYRDFFPGLPVSVSMQELKSGSLESEWLAGNASMVVAGPSDSGNETIASMSRAEAVIEEVSVGAARVEWLAQVPLWRGWSTERPPRSDGCQEDKLLFLLGEAECSSRWALGDRVRMDSALTEVHSVETYLDVRWQDDALSARVPARELQLCNPDAFSFFPSEVVCQRSLEETTGGGGPTGGLTPFRSNSPSGIPTLSSRGEAPSRGAESTGGERARRDDQPPRVGFVVRADPASRMVSVKWLDEGKSSEEEEWSAFDLQIDPEFGYRLGDAVIRCRDWEQSARESSSAGPRVGQVVALESGSVRVRWLDGSVSLHGPRELYRVGDEDEGSIAESQDAAGDGGGGDGGEVGGGGTRIPGAGGPHAPGEMQEMPSRAPTAELLNTKDAEGGADDDSTEEGATAGGPATEEEVASAGSGSGRGGDANDGGELANLAAPRAPEAAVPFSSAVGKGGPRPCPAASPEVCSTSVGAASGNAVHGEATQKEPEPRKTAAELASVTEMNEISFEDMAWEALPSDHHFIHCTHPPGAGQRQFMRRVQREWAILQRGVPRGVWVHVYPDRMELLRACLVGPEGTPYSDALFFFDVHLPPTYPQIPPQVRFWSFGENLNPNLYENGKVCLSLLGTWSGKDSETWSPERSNLLQVLVSILGLVLNTEPYYNEPGFERERDTPQGGLRSQRYNESVALSNYHLMLRVLRSPPSDFDRVVRRHFSERRAAILARAKRLREEESTLVSEGFKKSLAALVPRLEEVLPEATSGNVA
eukprot:TRINITY_DN40848_c0_g1_i1.p1 TRINITY_DN40848_c0_g1~~TRINITY_DN40848_c0_g1_i1.p1  ORF type:complete len:1003 (-),score=160.28 TRINITY_DN40848_c0_g1_i1:51-2756(-)